METPRKPGDYPWVHPQSKFHFNSYDGHPHLIFHAAHPTIPNEMIVHSGTILSMEGTDLIYYRIRPDPSPGLDSGDVYAWWLRTNGVILPGARVIWTKGAKPHWGGATILRSWMERPLESN